MIDRVKISKEFPGLWIGMESSVGSDITPEDALSEMEEKITAWYNKPHQISNRSGIIPETNLKDIRELEKLEDLLNEKRHLLEGHELFYAERVIDKKEKSSYGKLIKKLLELK